MKRGIKIHKNPSSNPSLKTWFFPTVATRLAWRWPAEWSCAPRLWRGRPPLPGPGAAFLGQKWWISPEKMVYSYVHGNLMEINYWELSGLAVIENEGFNVKSSVNGLVGAFNPPGHGDTLQEGRAFPSWLAYISTTRSPSTQRLTYPPAIKRGNSTIHHFPYAPCMEYLPTFTP